MPDAVTGATPGVASACRELGLASVDEVVRERGIQAAGRGVRGRAAAETPCARPLLGQARAGRDHLRYTRPSEMLGSVPRKVPGGRAIVVLEFLQGG